MDDTMKFALDAAIASVFGASVVTLALIGLYVLAQVLAGVMRAALRALAKQEPR